MAKQGKEKKKGKQLLEFTKKSAGDVPKEVKKQLR